MLVFKAWRKSPALTQETTPSQRRITRILSEAQQAAAREFGGRQREVADLLSRGQVDRVVAMLPTEPWLVAQEALAAELLGELLDAGSRVKLPTIEKATLEFSFDRGRPESVSWARQEAGNLISQITGEQGAVVREIVALAGAGEADWGDVSREVQGSIGLTTQQAGWVANYYERAFTNAIRGGASSSRARDLASASAARYQTSVHRYRANTIARTETMRAASEGRMQAWTQGITDGFISPMWDKEWVAEADACEICLGMDRKRVKVKQSFSVGEPPAHPNCRCDVILVPPTSMPQAGGGGGAGLGGLVTLFPWEELAFEFIPTPSLDEIREWRNAYRLATQQGDDRSFQQWFWDTIEPDNVAYASDGNYPEGDRVQVRPPDDDNILSLLPDDADPDDIFGDLLDESDLEDAYRGQTGRIQWDNYDAVEALIGYQWKDFLKINGFLRSGALEIPSEYLAKIQLIDSLFDLAPAWRAGGEYFRTLDARVLAGLKRGDTFIDDGFMSTSVSREAAEEFGEDAAYTGKMRIIDLSGSRKIYVDGITMEDGFQQGEVLFYRGTPLKYVGKDKDGWDVFTTASYKVDPPDRFARPGQPVNPALQFRDDIDFEDFEGLQLPDWDDVIYTPERVRDREAYEALGWYVADGYAPINSYMLTGDSEWDDDDPIFGFPGGPFGAARAMAALFDRIPGIRRDIRLWRAIKNIDYIQDLEPGSIFVHQNFMSTSALIEPTFDFLQSYDLFDDRKNDAILRINVPKGTKAIIMPGSMEWEVLLAAGLKLKIIKVTTEMLPINPLSSKLWPTTVIHVEIVP